MEILVRDAPCQDIAGDSRGSPAVSTQSRLMAGGLEYLIRGYNKKERGKYFEAGKEEGRSDVGGAKDRFSKRG